jgi:histidinol phosphate phosphatase HisJ family
MYLTDYHVHSDFSGDAEDSMLDMTLASGEADIDHICFTDHCDCDHYLTGLRDDSCFDIWPKILSEFELLQRECPSKLEVSLGLELGEANHYPEWGAKIASQPELDFIIGSVHSLRGLPDFYALKYESEEHCREILFKYIEELIETAKLDYIDVIGHIGYTKRYMLRAGFNNQIEEEIYDEPMHELIRTIVQNGKGIEINCSGFRHPGINATIPDVKILRMFKDMGGEIITVGSDAHKVSDAGRGIVHGFKVLQELGYDYVTIFRGRKPEFIKYM